MLTKERQGFAQITPELVEEIESAFRGTTTAVKEVFGADWSWSAADIAALKQAGVQFACRYLSHDPGKNLTPQQAQLLTQSGIAIVSNWESTANRADVAGFAGGQQDARDALAQALACGMPVGRPIYFSVDIDTTVGPHITSYFQGLTSILGVERVGVYGGYRIVAGCLDQGLARWGWQTYAWSGGRWDSRAHIRQYLNSQKIGRMDVDYNESMKADFGQWMVGRVAPQTNGGNSGPSPDPRDPNFQRMVRACQQALNFSGRGVDGIWGPNTERRGELMRLTGLYGGNDHARIASLQSQVLGFSGRDVDGLVGPKTYNAWIGRCKMLQSSMFVASDGIWGPTTDAAYRVMSPYV
jgi:peptidoglycan hydrolase-like protein with peptidoglycan-binding domain